VLPVTLLATSLLPWRCLTRRVECTPPAEARPAGRLQHRGRPSSFLLLPARRRTAAAYNSHRTRPPLRPRPGPRAASPTAKYLLIIQPRKKPLKVPNHLLANDISRQWSSAADQSARSLVNLATPRLAHWSPIPCRTTKGRASSSSRRGDDPLWAPDSRRHPTAAGTILEQACRK